MSQKSLLGVICGAAVACSSQLLLNSQDSIAAEVQGIVRVEQVRDGIFSVLHRRRWEENYYMTNTYMVDCYRKLATYKGERYLPLVTEEYLIEKICQLWQRF